MRTLATPASCSARPVPSTKRLASVAAHGWLRNSFARQHVIQRHAIRASVAIVYAQGVARRRLHSFVPRDMWVDLTDAAHRASASRREAGDTETAAALRLLRTYAPPAGRGGPLEHRSRPVTPHRVNCYVLWLVIHCVASGAGKGPFPFPLASLLNKLTPSQRRPHPVHCIEHVSLVVRGHPSVTNLRIRPFPQCIKPCTSNQGAIRPSPIRVN